jgi:hypothetical protein
MQTCGGCHDTQFIEKHSAHASLGYTGPGQLMAMGRSRPWDSGSGFFGGWDPLLYRYLSPEGEAASRFQPFQAWIMQFSESTMLAAVRRFILCRGRAPGAALVRQLTDEYR